MTLQQQLDVAYEKLGECVIYTDATFERLLDDVYRLEKLIEEQNKPVPMSYEKWEFENGCRVERKYEWYRQEYGDAMNVLLSEYKQQKYEEYLKYEKEKRNYR